jgi:hypothetical protein
MEVSLSILDTSIFLNHFLFDKLETILKMYLIVYKGIFSEKLLCKIDVLI